MDIERRKHFVGMLYLAVAGLPSYFFYDRWPASIGLSICLGGIVVYRLDLIPSGGIHTWLNEEGCARPFGICMSAFGLCYALSRMIWG